MAIELPTGWLSFVSGCAPCVPTAESMSEVDILFDAGVDASNRYSWSFIADNPDGEIVYEAASNNPFPSTTQLYKSINGVTSTETFPAGVGPMSNLAPGIADRPLLAWSSGGTFFVFTPDDNSRLDFNVGGHGFNGSNVRNWSVNGNVMFIGGDDLTDGSGVPIVAKYNFDTQAFVTFVAVTGYTNIQAFHYTGDFVYVLVRSSATTYTVLKYDTDLNLVDSFVLPLTTGDNNNGYLALFAKNDDAIYIIKRNILGPLGTIVEIGYVHDISNAGAGYTILDSEVVGSGFASDISAWSMIAHTDETTARTYLYLGRATQPSIFKYGFVECAS